MRRRLPVLLGLCVVSGAPLTGQEAGPGPSDEQGTKEQRPAKAEEPPKFSDVVTVTGSKLEQKLIDAPATMSVITSNALEEAPAQNMADVLRNVPGMNVIQTSARDINMTARQPTSTLATSQLVLVDGRSVYLDFFGLVLWDFVPSPTSGEIKQIEVVRGPASVVWGANAVSGVVNIITKTPRENQGLGLVLGAGLFNRDGGSRQSEGDGFQFNGGFSYASAVNDKWSYRLNAGYFNSEPYSRPVGTVPLSCHPLGANPCRAANGSALPDGYPLGGAAFPADASGPGSFENTGTSQPKFNLRVDQEFSNGGRVTYEGGYASTEGMVHTGIGPFDLQNGSYMAYGRAVYTKGALRIGAFGNFVDADAPNLLLTDPNTLGPIRLGFKTQTYDLEVGNSNVLGGRHILTYGGNVRQNNFDISLAPMSEDRTELGAYGQWEFFLSKFRLAAGARVDKFGNLADPVFSPRVSVMFKPAPDQSLRASYNRAFQSPSDINNYLSQNIQFPTPVDLRPLAALLPPPLQALVPPPFFLTINAFGNEDLTEQVTDSFELAYTGTFGGKTMVGLSVYRMRTNDNINFTYLFPPGTPGYPPPTYYDAAHPAWGITVPTPTAPAEAITLSPILMDVLAQVPPQYGGPILLPDKAATYLNLGPIQNDGIEASVDHRFSSEWSLAANYSWQRTPKILEASSGQIPYPVNEVGIPSEHRVNASLGYDGGRFFGNVGVNYASRALWVDVLNASYAGFTDPYTMLNATAGVRLADGKVLVSLKGTNLTNETIQQHIFGDILKRTVVAELRYFAR